MVQTARYSDVIQTSVCTKRRKIPSFRSSIFSLECHRAQRDIDKWAPMIDRSRRRGDALSLFSLHFHKEHPTTIAHRLRAFLSRSATTSNKERADIAQWSAFSLRAHYPAKDIKKKRDAFLTLHPFLSIGGWISSVRVKRKLYELWILRNMRAGNGKPDRRDILVARAKRKFATRHFRGNRELCLIRLRTVPFKTGATNLIHVFWSIHSLLPNRGINFR